MVVNNTLELLAHPSSYCSPSAHRKMLSQRATQGHRLRNQDNASNTLISCRIKHLGHARCSLHRPKAAAAVTSPTAANETQLWNQFAAEVSGEWEGVTATFSPAGQPQPLPEHYVPEAFREWDVQLWDWQQQCSSLATPDASSRRLRSVVRRLMPTVGCEADAIAFTEEDACSTSSSSSGDSSDGAESSNDQGLLFTADGSYSSGPAVLAPVSKDNGPSKFQVEHCFALPADPSTANNSSEAASSSRVRVKVVQQFRRDWSSGAWMLAAVDLHKERFDGPYTGKRELAGCGGGQPGIAQLPALQANQLAGDWAADGASVTASNGTSVQQGSECRLSCLDSNGAAAQEADGVQLTLLPLQAWSAVQLDGQGQLQRAEAGVVLQQPQQQEQQEDAGAADAACSGTKHKTRMVSCRSYDGATGRLANASIGLEAEC